MLQPLQCQLFGNLSRFSQPSLVGGRLTALTELDPAGAWVHHLSIKDQQRDLLASPTRVPHACATLGMGTPAPIGWE